MKSHDRNRTARAFTIVELLVVIAVIGTMVALILPAVQSARESARRTTCQNQLKQLALAALLHEETHGFLPTGGWGWEFVGDADRGFGARQPGGWFYSILPYFEQETTYMMGKGLTETAKMDAHAARNQTPVEGALCPSRRSADLLPNPHATGVFVNSSNYQFAAKIDYAANVGNVSDFECYTQREASGEASTIDSPVVRKIDCDLIEFNGVSYYFSTVDVRQITDGLSNTYLIGEKYLAVENYDAGTGPGDNETPYTGVNLDNFRTTSRDYPLGADSDPPGPWSERKFGSAHADGFYAADCSAAMTFVAFDVDPTVHEHRGVRDDGEILTAN